MIVGVALLLLILDRPYQSTRYGLISIPVVCCVLAGSAIWKDHRRRELSLVAVTVPILLATFLWLPTRPTWMVVRGVLLFAVCQPL